MFKRGFPTSAMSSMPGGTSGIIIECIECDDDKEGTEDVNVFGVVVPEVAVRAGEFCVAKDEAVAVAP